ncbi:Putative amino acid transporter, transmembrane domain-containing protein [Septoria linicola]|uniref:Amino acid transporter, transmembrane domain-containing protein n=1 Tax=Septoria linicola TaxID=215465 RepID=A0A9Q9EJD4_9PEZI|nr:putative amino acid transporter, transmembrane domain-containing protein [Septoria linicola]USW51213.1 Putative amino acid transporter, transmembrane domain-containing protein [Septoria linicola]
MPAQRGQLPASWTQYERGRADSADSRVQFDDATEQHHHHATSNGSHTHVPSAYDHEDHHVRRRRSSMGLAMDAITQAGGVNSIGNFARSWQRAVGFHEVTPVRQSFVYAVEDEDGEEYDDVSATTPTAPQHRSLLRQQLEARDGGAVDNAIEEEDGLDDRTPTAELNRTLSRTTRGSTAAATEDQPLLQKITSRTPADDSIFMIEPQLASPFGGSYGSTWGSLSSRVNESSMRHAGRLFRQQQLRGSMMQGKEREPLLVKKVQEDDGKVVQVIVGQSTLPQTIFNSVNVLIGVGLLALPLAMRYAGWIPGLIFFAFAGASTCYTAKLLAKCADIDNSLITFADLAFVSFGPWARIGTSILFSLELVAACVALVVLFADSLDALLPWGPTEWKIVCGVILVPLSFMPLRLLSFTSILGILSCFGIVSAVIIDGLIKPNTPGSLREPATTYLFPANWGSLPIAFGILMSPWGGHSVFPNIYRDMRHPYKYRRGVNITYAFTFGLDLLMAVVGLLMFGDGVKDEVTRNVLGLDGYPAFLSVFIVVCVAIIPLTKVPLNARPIVSTLELFLGLDARSMGDGQATHGCSGLTRGIMKITVRVLCVISFVLLAILIPQFDTIMSLLGAVACFTICLILPCAFHLKLFGNELSKRQKTVDWVLIVVSTVLAVVSTAFNFVPKDKLGI